jgi:hypothetical protein
LKGKQTQFLFVNVLEVVNSLPVWVLQALFVEISSMLNEKAKNVNLEKLDRTELLQLLVPEISEYGDLILKRHAQGLADNKVNPTLVKLLSSAADKKNVVDICIINRWTIEQCTKILLECIQKNYVKYNFPHSLYNTILFIAGEIRIGEFLIRKNKITTDQLEHALKLQSDLSNTFGERRKIVEILVNMGKINKDEVLDYLTLKELSKSYVTINPPRTAQSTQMEHLVNELRQNNEDLIRRFNQLNEEKKKSDTKLRELDDQLQLQVDRNNMLQKKLVDYEKRLSFFKKI